MPASFLSFTCPVGLEHLSQFLLDPWLRALTWFIDALCDFNKLRQGGWQRKLLVVAFASRPVGGHICLCSSFSFNLQRLCLWRKRGFLARTDSRTKVPPHSSFLCFCCSRVSIRVSLCLSCIHFYTGDVFHWRSGSQKQTANMATRHVSFYFTNICLCQWKKALWETG